jgi:hypothetical protein
LGKGGDVRRRYSKIVSRRAVTLLDLLVVIAIIGLLCSLLVPAIHASREAARKMQCQNNLRQLGIAAQLHHNSLGHFPTGGWGWTWAGEARRGYGVDQPGGWAFTLLPYSEEGDLFELSSIGNDSFESVAKVLQVPRPVYYCPSRRRPALYPYKNTFIPRQRNANAVLEAAKTDYAANAGDGYYDWGPELPEGPRDDSPVSVSTYAWSTHANRGLVYVRSVIRSADIRDGTSATLMFGEKSLREDKWTTGDDFGDDQSCYIGHDYDTVRWVDDPPVHDRIGNFRFFGSAHLGVANFVFCDGATRAVPYSVDRRIFQALGNRQDGKVVAADTLK